MSTKIVSPSESKVKSLLLTWTPRTIAAAIGGYYGLGVAYEFGLMAAIDRVAIDVIKGYAGYAGVGALMPTVQWYAALAVRVTLACITSLLYILVERIALSIGQRYCGLCQKEKPPKKGDLII